MSAIREREQEIDRLDVRIRTPKQAPNIERLREALTQRAAEWRETLRAAEWRETLRAEPKVARLLIRRLISPLELYDASLADGTTLHVRSRPSWHRVWYPQWASTTQL